VQDGLGFERRLGKRRKFDDQNEGIDNGKESRGGLSEQKIIGRGEG